MKFKQIHNNLTVAFLLALIILAAVHYLGYLVPYTYGILQMMTGALAVAWIATIMWRVTDRVIRHILLTIAFCLLLLFTLQNCRYNFFCGLEDIRRYLWYGFYIPMIMIPFLCYLMARNIDRKDEDGNKRRGIRLLLPAAAMSVGILTNDFHQTAFVFTEGIEVAVSEHGFGPLYYLYLLWAFGLFVTSLVIMLRKCLVNGSTRQLVYLIPPVLLFVLTLVYYSIEGHFPTINGVAVMTLGDLYGLSTVWILEIFLKIGLIPANHRYGELFRKTPITALITDAEGTPQFISGIPLNLTEEQKKDSFEASINIEENTRLSGRAITNGRCYWTDDITKINELEKSLRTVLQSIEAQNEILRSENEIIKQRESVQAQNLLYDRIAAIVKPQAEKILELLQRARCIPEERNDCIAGIIGYNSYIKRRSNLELIRYSMQSDGNTAEVKISVEELRLSIIESLRSLELYGVETFLTGAENGELDANLIIAAYEVLEHVLEENVLCMEVLSIHVQTAENNLALRLLIHLEEGRALALRPEELADRLSGEFGVLLQTVIREEEDDYNVKLSLKKGGGVG